ncbi:YopX family protein [Bacillus halotolerans]|uniref:YopX family protein n=1 Tax=Bacillus halotolerans TaxID=260554 RepID=UPI00403F74D7
MITAYRVWDGEHMHYWDDEGLSLTIKSNGDWTLKRLYTDVLVPVVDSTNRNAALMWGTGLKDKNNEAIYEKDIDMTANEPMIVFYKDGHYGLKYPSEIGYMDTCVYWEECEIGGNVYENPELLEGAK